MAKKNFTRNNFKEHRINDELKNYDTIRLIYKENNVSKSENDFTKIVSISEAFKLSEEYGLDLIEINGNVTPPIVRLQNYSKYLFELKKQQKNKVKNTVTCKEIQLNVNISEHDLKIKANKARDFINDGNKVKVVLTIKGRNLTRRDFSSINFYKFIDMLSDVAIPESMPKDDGNKVIVILKKK